jgi:hypothetical protein
MNSELRHHSSPSGIVISEVSLLPLSPKDKLNAYVAAIEIHRPAFDPLAGHICTFKGEEKPPAKDELTEKLVRTYDPAPYILGRFDCPCIFIHACLFSLFCGRNRRDAR